MKTSPSQAVVRILTPAIIVSILALSNSIPASPIAKAQTNEQRGLTVSQGAINAWPRKAKRFALIIGVDEYQDSQINKLEGASNDAKMLADALIQYGGFPSDQVIVFTSDQPSERRPTRGNILRRLSNLRSIVPQDGLLLFSFAGHGIERNGRAYLLPSDAQVSGDIALLEETAINAEVIRDWVRQTGIGQVVLILDACRNNPTAGRGNASLTLTEAYARGFNFDVRNRDVNAFVTLYATAVGQVAYEFKERKQGYFTWALVEGLKGKAANEQGEVTLAGLVNYLQDTVPKRVQLDLGGEKKQKPFAVVEGYKADDLVISVVIGIPSTTMNTGKVSESVDPATIELSFWDTIKNSNNPEDFKAYLQQYPNGKFVALAKIRASTSQSIVSSSQPPAPKPDLPTIEAKEYTLQLRSCKISGGSITCQFTITNNSAEDRRFMLYVGCGNGSARLFDNLGNEYTSYEGQLGTATGIAILGYSCAAELTLVPRVPTKGWLKFNNVSREANTITLLRLACMHATRSNPFGEEFTIDLRDIPIGK